MTTTQQIKPGLLFTLPTRRRSYKVLNADGAEYWMCEITADRSPRLIGLLQGISAREIQDALSKGSVPCKS